MIWQSAAEFWAMGGYGVYVWGSLGVSGALLVLEVWLARKGRQHTLDAVSEAMDAEALDTETPGTAEAFSAGAPRTVQITQGAVS